MDNTILEKARTWLNQDVFDENAINEIQSLIDNGKESELTDRFYKDLEFGTGGMRGILGAGTAYMNIYNIRKATMAVAQEIQTRFPDEKEKWSIGVSYDSRHFSVEFSKAVCEVFAAYGIRSYRTEILRPVPLLSYLVRWKECHAGVCITASHNPPNYNGYKLYWKGGAQVVPPIDTAIVERYGMIQDYGSIQTVNYDEGVKSGMIVEVGQELEDAYFSGLESFRYYKSEDVQNTKIVFTPLHGTAGAPLLEGFRRFGFTNVSIVKEQEKPDGDFPTVKFPNPEDPEALALAVAQGEREKADLILGTDPDCDRIGIVYKDKDGSYVYLNGNEIGCLLTEFVLRRRTELGTMPENPVVIKTIVTTELQRDVSNHYGVVCDDTLTGFKWICGRVAAYENGELGDRKRFVCGGEESFGFLNGDFVRDKDGISACLLAAEMVAFYKGKNLTLTDVLHEIHERHGLYRELLVTQTFPGAEGVEVMQSMMKSFRENPPEDLNGSKVVKIDDVLSGKRRVFKNGGWVDGQDLEFASSNVLQFYSEEGAKLSVRPSGTEPKIKFYVSVKGSLKDSKKSLDEACQRIVDALVERKH